MPQYNIWDDYTKAQVAFAADRSMAFEVLVACGLQEQTANTLLDRAGGALDIPVLAHGFTIEAV